MVMYVSGCYVVRAVRVRVYVCVVMVIFLAEAAVAVLVANRRPSFHGL